MQWSDVITDPALKDLPYKIETNEYGQLVMSPHKRRHAIWQGEIEWCLRQCLPQGRTAPEFAVDTDSGTKTPDVVWYSRDREAQLLADQRLAPEICIEVLFNSKTEREMATKRTLYFAAGALEVWQCDDSGALRFFTPAGEQPQSTLAPQFPRQLD
ncbi:Putative restriction endonuclease [Allochromatium warmingii]|uniref:Putative restriction endonuclease n=1 Tax=Allochromatium warmingii TaxID=61595 RepID=A0A1H3ITZ7_ALLWA|nr:Uma2 family endonuclease [Allochromatium warmingii]SDY31181.1 Putative restriction endonuclease [Allochromatium warmingii]